MSKRLFCSSLSTIAVYVKALVGAVETQTKVHVSGYTQVSDSINRLTKTMGHELSLEPYITFRVFDPNSGLTFEGDNLTMNLKTNQFVDLTALPKTASGRPGKVENGRWTAVTDTDAFSVGPVPGEETNVLRQRVTANRDANGDDADVGIVRFEADGIVGEGESALVGEIAINVLPEDSTVMEISAGAVGTQPDVAPVE